MSKTNVLAAFGVMFLALLVACAPPPAPATESKKDAAKPATEAGAKPAWQQDWEKTVAAAKQEGVVVISTSTGPAQNIPIRAGFMKAYGIDIEYVVGRSAERVEKLYRERRASLYLEDIHLTGANTFVNALKPAGVFDPLKPQLVLPEVLDAKAWYGGSHMYIDSEGSYIFAMSYLPVADLLINTGLVKPNELRTTTDLLNPKWKGKITMSDPTTSGGGNRWVHMASRVLGWDFIREYAKQEPQLSRDNRQLVEWVARGKHAILVGAYPAAVAEFLDAGAPLAYVIPSDVVYAWAGNPMALLNKAPHPNAAKVFMNWLLTREGQTIHTKSFLMQSLRLDVPANHLPPELVRQPGLDYLNSDAEAILLDRPKTVAEAQRIFASAGK